MFGIKKHNGSRWAKQRSKPSPHFQRGGYRNIYYATLMVEKKAGRKLVVYTNGKKRIFQYQRFLYPIPPKNGLSNIFSKKSKYPNFWLHKKSTGYSPNWISTIIGRLACLWNWLIILDAIFVYVDVILGSRLSDLAATICCSSAGFMKLMNHFETLDAFFVSVYSLLKKLKKQKTGMWKHRTVLKWLVIVIMALLTGCDGNSNW